jgi:PASTA domain
MRLTAVPLAVVVAALVGAASASAQETGASLELSGVPAKLTIPSSFTMTVKGSTGAASHAVIYPIYGPAPCAATVEAQLAASAYEFLASTETDEVPSSGLTGSFTIHVQGVGQAVSSPGLYTICVFMEASEESEAVEPSEEEKLVALASASFTVPPALTSTSPTAGSTGGVTKCVVPPIKARKLAFAEKAIGRAHCAVGKVRKASSKHVRKGRVISQSRSAGKSLPQGTTVSLVVSKG